MNFKMRIKFITILLGAALISACVTFTDATVTMDPATLPALDHQMDVRVRYKDMKDQPITQVNTQPINPIEFTIYSALDNNKMLNLIPCCVHTARRLEVEYIKYASDDSGWLTWPGGLTLTILPLTYSHEYELRVRVMTGQGVLQEYTYTQEMDTYMWLPLLLITFLPGVQDADEDIYKNMAHQFLLEYAQKNSR
ncbi:MAG: hypothetical protein KDK39_17060 [Leptospiraceae bacterium]|nr:hypothetical protein [Leptospiraceae bacterium]